MDMEDADVRLNIGLMRCGLGDGDGVDMQDCYRRFRGMDECICIYLVPLFHQCHALEFTMMANSRIRKQSGVPAHERQWQSSTLGVLARRSTT
jgi:hypothetical protein